MSKKKPPAEIKGLPIRVERQELVVPSIAAVEKVLKPIDNHTPEEITPLRKAELEVSAELLKLAVRPISPLAAMLIAGEYEEIDEKY